MLTFLLIDLSTCICVYLERSDIKPSCWLNWNESILVLYRRACRISCENQIFAKFNWYKCTFLLVCMYVCFMSHMLYVKCVCVRACVRVCELLWFVPKPNKCNAIKNRNIFCSVKWFDGYHQFGMHLLRWLIYVCKNEC